MSWPRARVCLALAAAGLFVWQQPFTNPFSAPRPLGLATALPTQKVSPKQKLLPLQIRVGVATTDVPASIRRRWARATPQAAVFAARRWLARHGVRIDSGRVGIRLAWSAPAVRQLVTASRTSRRSVASAARLVSVELRLPAIQQVYRNDCEAAALSIFLRGAVDQRLLQQELPIADPLNQETAGGQVVWGDPEAGFVGDVHGGGYGVYDRPLLKLARRYDPGATDLTGRPFSALLANINQARPVISWIALGPSLPVTWQTPAGRTISANYAEHTIVLTGVHGQTVSYIDPWDGLHKTMSTERLRRLWLALGGRALAGSTLWQPAVTG